MVDGWGREDTLRACAKGNDVIKRMDMGFGEY
jgi:hypothetical protein